MKRVPTTPADAEDRRLFRDAVGAVRPVAAGALPLQRKRPAPRRRRADVESSCNTWAALPFDPVLPDVAEQLCYLRTGCAPTLLRQLQRGRYPIQGDLDMHQMRAAMAHTFLNTFLAHAQQCGWRCVHIVHGKGLRSGPRGPVLKKLTDRMLRENADVLAFASAPPALGGTGAVLVLLRAA